MKQIDFTETLRQNIPPNYKIPHRSQVYVGFGCHQKCGFCYYKSKCGDGMFEKSYVLRQIDLLIAYGITDFEITGGEPSECKDLRCYCEYIKEKNKNFKIAIITNGGLWKCNIWDLIDEVLISYHLDKNPDNYNKNIFPLGSTYKKVIKTVEKARENDIFIRTNTVIGTFNIERMDFIVNDLINDIQPSIINLLPVNLFDEAEQYGMEKYINYSNLRPILKKSIDKIRNKLKNTLVFVRFMPFCDMDGYEQHIVGTLQHIYDFFDWNVEMCGYNLMEYLKKYKTNDEILQYLGKFGDKTYEKANDAIKNSYEKSSKCLTCKFYMICDGVERTNDHHLLSNIVPTKGKMIKNYMEYIKNTTENVYNILYEQ